ATAIHRIESKGVLTMYLRRETRNVEKKLRELLNATGETAKVRNLLDQAILEVLAESTLDGDARAKMEQEFAQLMDAMGSFEFAVTKPYWITREKKEKGSG